jgi:hypothetical protein
MKTAFLLVAGAAALIRTDKAPVDMMSNGDMGCYMEEDSGKSYVGLKDSTKSGRKCQRWTESKPHAGAAEMTGELLGNHAYCRNPDGSMGAPWCYTLDDTLEKEECEIPVCKADGPFARDFPTEADELQSAISSKDCECADQLYGSTTTTKDTSVGKAGFLQKPCPCAKK